MAFTNSATVKKIIQTLPTTFPNIFDEELKLDSFTKSFLQYTAIDAASEVVKIVRQITPTNQNLITLNDETPANLSGTFIVPKTVVVASDQTLATLYIENDDYLINYSTGTVARCLGTTIPNGSTISIWYIPYTQLTEGSDYNIDNAEGSIVRRAGTSIPDGARVYIDYSHTQQDVSDNLIDETILQSDEFFLKIIKDEHLASMEQTIKSASTNYTMYLICLSMSQKALRLGRTISDDLADKWIKLSEHYLSSAETFLSWYRKFSRYNEGDKKINENATFADRPPRFSFKPGRSK